MAWALLRFFAAARAVPVPFDRTVDAEVAATAPEQHELRRRLNKWNERMKFGTNSGNICLFPHFSGTFYEKLETFHHFLRISVKFWQNSIKISQKNDQIHWPKSEWNEISFHSGQKVWRSFPGILRLAVRRQRNHVELEKSWKMRLFSLS